MGRVNILDYVDQAYSSADGRTIYEVIVNNLKAGRPVQVSFEGIDAIPTSFVNNAFIPLLQEFSFEDIKRYVSFIHTTSQINNMLRSRFQFETSGERAARKLALG